MSQGILYARRLTTVAGNIYCFGRWCDKSTCCNNQMRIADWRIADGRTLEIRNVLALGPPNWGKHSHSPTLRVRHRFTTFWRVGTAIHNFGRRDSQFGPLDSQLGSQLLVGKRLEWRSLLRDRHSHSASSSTLTDLSPSTTTYLLHHVYCRPLPPIAFSPVETW